MPALLAFTEFLLPYNQFPAVLTTASQVAFEARLTFKDTGMIRVRGRIGDLPVELEIELGSEDWQNLRDGAAQTAPSTAPKPVVDAWDGHWEGARALLRQAGELSGPQLLDQLAAFAGSPQAGKRLLVRLRHCAQVKVEPVGGPPLYRWVG